MDRRTFLTTSATGAILAAAGGGPAAAAPSFVAPDLQPLRPDARRLRAGLSAGWTADYFADVALRFGNAVALLSGGRLGLELKPSTEEGVPQRTDSRADIWFCFADELSAVDSAFSYFGGLPMGLGMPSGAHEAWLTAAGGQLFWDDLGARHGLKPLSIGQTAATAGAWLSTDWVSARDLVSARAAATGSVAEVLRRCGVSIVSLPASSQPSALAAGEIVFAEPGIPLVAAIAASYGAGSAASLGRPISPVNHVRRGVARGGTVLACGIAASVWADFDASEQAIVEAAAASIAREIAAETTAHQALVAPGLRERRGIAQTSWTEEIERALTASAVELVAELAARDAETRRLHDAYFGFRCAATGLPDPRGATAALA